MNRHLVPGTVDRHGRAHPAATECCNGNCNQGRTCPVRESELSNVVPLRPHFPAPPFGITGGRVPLRTRAKRLLEDLVFPFREFVTVYAQYRRFHPRAYAALTAWRIAFRGLPF